MANIASGVPTADIDKLPQFAPGDTQQYGGKTYRYVRCGMENAVAAAVGCMVYYTSAACDTITTDESDGVASGCGSAVAGVWVLPAETVAGEIFDNFHWCWIQVTGVAIAKGVDGIVAGDSVFASIVDGELAPTHGYGGLLTGSLADDPDTIYDLGGTDAISTEQATYCCGIALSATSRGYVSVRLTGLL